MTTTRDLSRMQKLLEDIEGSSAPPYYAEYLPVSADAADIALTEYPGLSFCYLIQEGEVPLRFATAWRSRDFYEREGERLRTALQAPPAR